MPPPDLPPLAGLFMAVGGAMGIAICAALLLAPRWIWPEKFREAERPEEAADWSWKRVLAVSAVFVGMHLATVASVLAPKGSRLFVGMLVAGLAEVGLVVLAWRWLCVSLRKPARALALRPPAWGGHWVVAPVIGYGLALSAVLVAVGVQISIVGEPPSPQDTLEQMKKITGPAMRALVVAIVVVLAPLAEEILFRGVLYRWMRPRLGRVFAAIVSAALFSAVHLQAPQAALLFALGLVLAFVVEETRSLWPAILLHAIFNGVSLAATWMMAT